MSSCVHMPQEPPQSNNDCKRNECNAAGKVVVVEDLMDKPLDDGKPCTIEKCNGTEPEPEFVPQGTPCGAVGSSEVCDAMGECVDCKTIDECALGMLCDDPSDCNDGNPCADGVCCADSCTNPCASCKQPMPGTCTLVASGQQGKCPQFQVCNDTAECKTDLGRACSPVGINTTCITAFCCPTGMYHEQCRKPIGASCSDDSDCCTNKCNNGNMCDT
jgi:hypothetical protein